jgi:gamma-glutamyltranspeptidase/glutathione hydrolase
MGHAYVLSNWLDFGLDLQEAVDAARFMPEAGKLLIERSFPESTRKALTQRGCQTMVSEDSFGGAQCIFIDAKTGVLQAASDPRKDGCALGY